MASKNGLEGTLSLLFVVMRKGLANLGDMRAMNPNRLMQLLPRDMKLLRPIVNIGRELRIDLMWIMRALLSRKFAPFWKWC